MSCFPNWVYKSKHIHDNNLVMDSWSVNDHQVKAATYAEDAALRISACNLLFFLKCQIVLCSGSIAKSVAKLHVTLRNKRQKQSLIAWYVGFSSIIHMDISKRNERHFSLHILQEVTSKIPSMKKF
jgi:hypothetical protein